MSQNSILSSESIERHSSLRREYRELIMRYAMFAHELGFDLVAEQPGHSYFNSLPFATQIDIVATLRLLTQTFAEMREDGESLLDDKQLLWRIIRQLDLRPVSDLFSRITDDDLIEIYDTKTNAQVYRSFRFFAVCSYTLDELLCRPWWELYRRADHANERIAACVQKLIAPGNQDSVSYHLEPYVLEEIDSQKQLSWVAFSRFLSPLFEGNTIKAAVNVVRAISSNRQRGLC